MVGKRRDPLSLEEDPDTLDQPRKKKRKHKHHKHKKDKTLEKDDGKSERRKHKKHKRPKKERDTENGTVEEKILPTRTVIVTPRETQVNGKVHAPMEVVSTEESEDEKLVDLDSDEVDCTIIEDDIDLEELMKQKVNS